ncbi:MAG: hypothetical protein IPL61_23435 [Myxococcales bacterium]|nr:hypothetical protein [Myxococcales bacterium]
MLRLAAIVTVATSLCACAHVTRNHQRGFAAVGAVATLFGVTTLADGVSCDTRYNARSTCTHDAAELRNGAIITTAGAALLGAALWQLAHMPDDEAPPPRSRLAHATPAPAPAPTPAPAGATTSAPASAPAP